MLRFLVMLVCAGLVAGTAEADDDRTAFVEANVLGIFYHELGHAMIDLLDLPIFGQEEDAADVASILMIDLLWEDATALDLAYATADGFYAEARRVDADEVTFWGVHGPDAQRFYNTVCLFYGGNPESRRDFAEYMELPTERADTCAEEYDLALKSWGAVFETLSDLDGADLTFQSDASGDWVDLLAAEVAALNDHFSWPEKLTVSAGPCGEANAWYNPGKIEIRFCSEFVPHLDSLYVP